MTSNQEKKLGRGLSALLGESRPTPSTKVSSGSKKTPQANIVTSIPLSRIIAGIYQPRRKFTQNELSELADSIKENGLIQPILVRKSEESGHFEIIAGERRYRAYKILKMQSIPAIVKKINNHEALELAIVENVQRSDLTLIEEALGYKQLMDDFSYTQDQVAKRTGKSRSHVANLIRLLQLPEPVKEMLNDRVLSLGHAKAIGNSNDPEKLANKIVNDSLTVRDVEDIVRNEKIETLKSSPVVAQKETKIKFVNSGELTDLENKISQCTSTNAKISFNQFRGTGKLTISFDELDKIYYILDKLES